MGTERCLVPWTQDMSLGMGYDTDVRQIKASPLIYETINTNEDQSGDMAFRVQSITNEVEFKRAIDTSLSVGGNMPVIYDAKVSAGIMQGVRCHETAMTTIIQYTVTRPGGESVNHHPSLRPEASSLLQRSLSSLFKAQPQVLLERYGQYYIHSYISQASITIIARHFASSRQELERFQNSTVGQHTGSALSTWRYKHLTNWFKTLSTSTIRTEVDVLCNGISSRESLRDLSSNEAIKIFDECRKNIQPRKSFAVLRPLATVDPRVPSGIVRNAHQRIKDEWIDTLFLANRVKDANMVCAQNCHSALERLANELGVLMQAKVVDETQLAPLLDRRAALEAKISLADRRQNLLDISRGDPIPKQDKWFDTEREGHVWSYGCVDPDEYGLADEIERHEKVHRMEGGFTRQEGTVRLSCGRRKIIGIKVTSNLESYWRFEQTTDNDHAVEIRVKTRRLEDGKWTLNAGPSIRSCIRRTRTARRSSDDSKLRGKGFVVEG